MTVTLVSVLFVASAIVAIGAFAAAWRRDLVAALAGIPLMFGGTAVAFVGVARFASRTGALLGQEAAVLLAIAALAGVILGVALAGREKAR